MSASISAPSRIQPLRVRRARLRVGRGVRGCEHGSPPHHDPVACETTCSRRARGFRRKCCASWATSEQTTSSSPTPSRRSRCRTSPMAPALIGDAAHCPTFLSGMGSSLALQDAHILAGCLARTPGDRAASLTRYEEVMTRIARRYKDSAVTVHRAFLGSSRFKGAPPECVPARGPPAPPRTRCASLRCRAPVGRHPGVRGRGVSSGCENVNGGLPKQRGVEWPGRTQGLALAAQRDAKFSPITDGIRRARSEEAT